MNLVIKRRSLKALLALLIYKSLLDYAYMALLSEHFSYTGIVNNTNVVKIEYATETSYIIKTVWHRTLHDAGTYGTKLIESFKLIMIEYFSSFR